MYFMDSNIVPHKVISIFTERKIENNTHIQNVIHLHFQKESILPKFSKKKNTIDGFYSKTANGLIIESVHIIITSLLQ